MNAAAGEAASGRPGPAPRIDTATRAPAWWIGLLPVAAVFLAAIWQMRIDWTYDETYHYGWVVPALAGYLISVRWRDRPAADPSPHQPTMAWAGLGIALGMTWLVREANPDWRLMGVALGGLAVASGLLWFHGAGGRPWLRHFAGAVAFFAVGVPWPTVFERAMTEALMPANAVLALEALHWLGIPAVRSGNLITLREGTLGVEEACSGIRSLQATMMMALFLGELYRLRGRDRWVLLALGVGTALLTNALRTIFLSAVAARSGLAEASRWHNTAGLTVLAVHAVGLFAATYALARRVRRAPVEPAVGHAASPPVRGPALLACAIAMALPVTFFWYHRHKSAPPVEWSLQPPREAPAFQEVPIAGRTRLILRYDTGWSARWRTAQGLRLHGFFLRWKAGSVPPESLFAHHPGNCLSLAGMTLEDESAEPLMAVGPGGPLALTCLRFNDRGQRLFVAHAVDEVTSREPATPGRAEGLTYRGRLRAAWLGRRSEGQRLIEIGLWGVSTEAEARSIFREFIEAHLTSSP